MDIRIATRRILLIASTVVVLLSVFQYFLLISGQHSRLRRIETGFVRSSSGYVSHLVPNRTGASCSQDKTELVNEVRRMDTSLSSIEREEKLQKGFMNEKETTRGKMSTARDCIQHVAIYKSRLEQDSHLKEENNSNANRVGPSSITTPLVTSSMLASGAEKSTTYSRSAILNVSDNVYLQISSQKAEKIKHVGREKNVSVVSKRATRPLSISQMNSLLLHKVDSSRYTRPDWQSVPDQDLLSAKLLIENAPVLKRTPRHYASIYRNISIFKRSYDLMERMFKVYIYQEGDDPIFHQPNLKGIYASEGWFIKLMEDNQQFVVKDPGKAHLFFLPFSLQKLRLLDTPNTLGLKGLIKYLDNYIDMIAGKYSFWNRTSGTDHFIVACHDWGLRVTGGMRNSIRVLCNANIERGFVIGKDISLPVTYVRKVEEPLRDVGGKPPSERPTLAFFAGSMHGYLRPILLQYWENKEPDMKIIGSLPRDSLGKKMYREHMRSSKYCICARGYEVHTPRIVEAIFHECVPVIVSDNYVPPFFEVLNWEAFAVFVLEKDVPNLRNILLSIPKKKYLVMQRRVKIVQKHFFWHKIPVKYDLFHMILHSVWHNRVSMMKT